MSVFLDTVGNNFDYLIETLQCKVAISPLLVISLVGETYMLFAH